MHYVNGFQSIVYIALGIYKLIFLILLRHCLLFSCVDICKNGAKAMVEKTANALLHQGRAKAF